ncbi:hypothetical protein C0Q70_16544 [Pomacea canaliculata]|uniref:Replication termination factor 2 n=1 Tax=Pomacea canaliculata TaxID=400727 RepID=A0A2T7NQ33_POMCA|nr:protein RTF2 homolog [Pomacea canaliculata]PVD23278.1 hypothetical protein C0Q70_16544 [Pomacea canaliculata]
MGCDGGTIPKRDELVKTKKKPEQKDKAADLAFRWRHCAISQEVLVQPIMACELGRLYNKESALEFLIDRSKFECASSFEHLRGLKDLKQLNLTKNPAGEKQNSAEKGDGYIDMQLADYICPVSGFEMNGKYRFCFLWSCGCVCSERAMKEVKTQTCHKCGKSFTENDVVVINGSDDDTTQNQYKMDNRRLLAKMAKKSKKTGKQDTPAETATSSDGCSSAKRPCLGPPSDASSTSCSSSEKSHLTAVADDKRRFTNGDIKQKPKASAENKGNKLSTSASRSIQQDPKASAVYKSLFTSCQEAKKQKQAHWVTFNPQYF